jgi:hypothetical protein
MAVPTTRRSGALDPGTGAGIPQAATREDAGGTTMSEDKDSGFVNTSTYAFFQPPKPVGAWVLDPGGVVHTQFSMYSKPTDEQIKNTEAMFGWKWRDLP